jgi:DNA processing protein
MEKVITKKNKEYPKLLSQLGDAPKQLYYKGNWDSNLFTNCLAVVGTRRMTSYGKRITEQLVGEIAATGITIVSGFMYGIDATAHQTALRVGGKTIAVMPCGIDLVHPEYQADIHTNIIKEGGLVVSEYEGTHSALSWMFPRRNRIVAGLCQATLVVEAGERSGSLITANFAKKYGRKVFAIPNPITSGVSQGVTQLLKEGAYLVSSGQDILHQYGFGKSNRVAIRGVQSRVAEVTGAIEKKIVQQLEKQPLQVDELARKLQTTPAQLGAALSLLQLEGFVSQEQGKLYVN